MASSNPAEALDYGWALLLGLIQGLTEFLPVSSSGHLALAERLGMGQAMPISFDVLLHVATVLVVVNEFWKDMVKDWQEQRAILMYLVLGSIPAAIAGLTLESTFDALRDVPMAICGALVATGVLLVLMERAKPEERDLRSFGISRTLLVGMAQALAITPGISRSGATIATGTLCGLNRDEAVRFSFMLMVPAVLGAGALNAWSDPDLLQLPAGPAAAGFVAALITGAVALKLLIRVIRQRKMIYFSVYCLAIATAGFIYFGLIAA